MDDRLWTLSPSVARPTRTCIEPLNTSLCRASGERSVLNSEGVVGVGDPEESGR